jgi:hypothetical protein
VPCVHIAFRIGAAEAWQVGPGPARGAIIARLRALVQGPSQGDTGGHITKRLTNRGTAVHQKRSTSNCFPLAGVRTEKRRLQAVGRFVSLGEMASVDSLSRLDFSTVQRTKNIVGSRVQRLIGALLEC